MAMIFRPEGPGEPPHEESRGEYTWDEATYVYLNEIQQFKWAEWDHARLEEAVLACSWDQSSQYNCAPGFDPESYCSTLVIFRLAVCGKPAPVLLTWLFCLEVGYPYFEEWEEFPFADFLVMEGGGLIFGASMDKNQQGERAGAGTRRLRKWRGQWMFD